MIIFNTDVLIIIWEKIYEDLHKKRAAQAVDLDIWKSFEMFGIVGFSQVGRVW